MEFPLQSRDSSLALSQLASCRGPCVTATLSRTRGPERVQTMLDGVPTLAGWLQYLQGLLFFGAFGALGGIAFWATLRVAGQLPFRRADAEDISPHSHRPSVLPWRAFLLGAVPLLAIAVLAVPA